MRDDVVDPSPMLSLRHAAINFAMACRESESFRLMRCESWFLEAHGTHGCACTMHLVAHGT